MARLTGSANELLSYEEVRKTLKATNTSDRGLHQVPLNAIVGSVNRYTDFTRDFLPRNSIDASRWARVEIANNQQEGLPPIDVYKIGEVYFVKDGNHRVSVARQNGAGFIQAYVTEVQTRIPLTPDAKPDDLILKAEYADFLERTRLDEIRPDADMTLTVAGAYPVLEEHIHVHQYYMGIDLQRPVTEEEAVAHWFDTVYMPVANTIQRLGILRDFPGRTVADLYLWISEHRAGIEENIGREIRPEDAASQFAADFSSQPVRIASRLTGRILSSLLPQTIHKGPSAGQWRKAKETASESQHMFSDILVPVSGQPGGWSALGQAIDVARREEATLHGLHVLPLESDLATPEAQAIEFEFNRICAEAGLPGKLVLTSGDVSRKICEYARWSDLVVLNLAYPPAAQSLVSLSSGFKSLIQRCPRPILAVPGTTTPMQNALLAYDGSPKAKEALFAATHLAGEWDMHLTVLTIFDGNKVYPETLAEAWDYLESHEVEADYVKRDNVPVAQTILQEAEERECDLLLMGGYGYGPLLDVVLGNQVDQVLRESHRPVLICR